MGNIIKYTSIDNNKLFLDVPTIRLDEVRTFTTTVEFSEKELEVIKIFGFRLLSKQDGEYIYTKNKEILTWKNYGIKPIKGVCVLKNDS